MTFTEWTAWLKDLPWAFKWFPVLVILRPVIDNLYFLKEVSPVLSPPYIVGVLTPILCINAFVRYKFPKFNTADKAFLYWSVAVIFGVLLLLFYDPFSLLTIEFVLKLSMPVYIYFFLRLFITDLRDLHGVLQSFLFSTIFVAVLLVYEVFVNPIGIEESRGMVRIQASFGDVVSYGMYITFSLIVASYYFFARQHLITKNRRLILVIAVTLLALLGLANIHHTASYTVFVLLLLLFILFNFRLQNRSVAIAIIFVAGVVISFWGSQIINEQISPLVQTDIEVYSGVQDSDRLLHGRVGRWRMMLGKFSSESVAIQFFGYPLKLDYVYQFIGIGSHNDFVRILFSTGIVGLFLYLFLLVNFWMRRVFLGPAQRYLLTASFTALLFYSISVTPTLYAPFMYFVLTVFAYVALTGNKLTQWKNRAY
ncbi:hypothetical protein G3O08_13320 [Cryomorpha ignava]|uniref:O-antigen ligase family protein n=1 Tax=Cryomorpha ignava TaxID=101383 RepID=A0A7K3WSM4_9FLAO|nr:hypothetical protein [Cryomorpha ignava]NEN24484.1 hypothetical protein [Cryomorpha ignava]